jgi:hypothetical protein
MRFPGHARTQLHMHALIIARAQAAEPRRSFRTTELGGACMRENALMPVVTLFSPL